MLSPLIRLVARLIGLLVGMSMWWLLFHGTDRPWLKQGCFMAGLILVVLTLRDLWKSRKGRTPP